MKFITHLIFATVLSAMLPAQLLSQEVLQWRGNDRSGFFREDKLLPKWPAEGPPLLWEFMELGNGYGSPVITSSKIYVNGEIDSISYLFCLDHSGKFIWKSRIGKEWVRTYPGSRSTPSVVGNLLYVTAGMGSVSCIEESTGKLVWSCDMVRDFHAEIPRFGFSESLLVDGNRVFCIPGNRDTNVVALDRFSGKMLWKCSGAGEIASYCSPMLIRLPGKKILVCFTKSAMLGIDSENGKLLWTYPQPGEENDCQVNTPYFENGILYIVNGNGNGTVKFRVSEDGNTISELWRNQKCDGLTGGFIKTGDYLYTSGYERRKYYVLDANTGKMTDSLNFDRGTVNHANGMLYIYNEKGLMGLARPEGPKISLVSSFKITAGTKAHFAHPVICNGILYIRHGKSLLAYDIWQKDQTKGK